MKTASFFIYKGSGRISIANSDAEALAYTNAAIDQAYRAVKEVSRFSKVSAG